ncbi:MAG: SH3 domain-containing protein [Candidatus Dormibacteraeota bacterium]|nr:SH3 domain-containing protein [Candidatus Dormibacteraeota bacterium]
MSSRIIRSAPRLLLGLALAGGLATAAAALAACGGGSSGAGPSAAPSPSAKSSATPTPAGNSVWVVATVPVKLHGAPDRNSAQAALLEWGAQLTVSESQKPGPETWLHVKTEGGSEGWVLDDPVIVSHRSVAKKISDTYRLLYPSDWTVAGANPLSFSSPQGAADAATLVVQTAGEVGKLPVLPLTPGTASGDDSVQVGDKTYTMHSWKSGDGGAEAVVSFQEGGTAYLFDLKQKGRSSPDRALFKSVLQTVILNPSSAPVPGPSPTPSG